MEKLCYSLDIIVAIVKMEKLCCFLHVVAIVKMEKMCYTLDIIMAIVKMVKLSYSLDIILAIGNLRGSQVGAVIMAAAGAA